MPVYKPLDEVELARRDNQDLIRMQGRHLLRRMLNDALAQQEIEFQKGLQRNQILELDPDKGELKELLLKSSQKVLTQ